MKTPIPVRRHSSSNEENDFMTPKTVEETQKADCSTRLVRWRVTGICMVPNEVELFIWAESKAGAERSAVRRFKDNPRDVIVGNSSDERSAYDFQPTAEECPANDKDLARRAQDSE